MMCVCMYSNVRTKYIVNKPLPWYVVLSYTGPRLTNCPKSEQMRDFEDNLEAKGLYKLNTTYHGSGVFILSFNNNFSPWINNLNKTKTAAAVRVKRT